MDRITLACVVVFIISGLHDGIAARKPTIRSNAKDGIIQEGNELKIFCEGDSELHFSLMDIPDEIEPCNRTVNYGQNNASFLCHNATKRDTGWYACAEKGIEIRNTEQTIQHADDNIAWIHVYVNSTAPFAQTHSMKVLHLRRTSPVVIPCRTTSPDWNVTARVNDENLMGSFDPKIGFIVTEDFLFGLLIQCSVINHETIASYDVSHTGSVFYHLDEEIDVSIPDPRIDETALRHVVWGRDLNMICKITVQHVMHSPILDWKIPKSIQNKQQKEHQSTMYTADNKYTIVSNLTIVNVTESDGGNYTCFVQGHGDGKAEETYNVKLWDPNYFFVNISVAEGDVAKSIVGQEGKTSRWNIKIDTYPEYSKLTWYRKNGEEMTEINFKNSSKYSVRSTFLVDRSPTHLFEIHNSDVHDIGEYVIRVMTKHGTGEITLHLTVNAAPVSKITPSLTYVAPGQSTNFLCKTVSHPLANITWSYMEWPNFPSWNGSRSAHLLDSEELPNIDAVTSVSRLKIQINETGSLTCKSCNHLACVEVTKLIYVSDVNASFAIIAPETVVEGDNITITCGVSVYRHNFSDGDTVLKWNVNSSLELGTGRIKVLQKKTKFTYQSILQISRVNRSDDRIYICDVIQKSKDFKSQTYNLTVMAGHKPIIYEWNMNTSQLVIHKDNKRKDDVILKCLADGMPKPETTWLKDNKPLTKHNGYEILEAKSELRIRYFIEQDSGRYTCRVVNRFGSDERSVDIILDEEQSHINPLTIGLICTLVVIIIIIMTYVGLKVSRERLSRKKQKTGSADNGEGEVKYQNLNSDNNDRAELLPYNKK